MKPESSAIAVRALPVVLAAGVATGYVVVVEWPGPYIFPNILPMLVTIVLALVCLYRGGGRWNGAGWRWPFATAGFALPAVGVSLYLHYGYAIDRGGMASEAIEPEALFRYLPIYALFAGGIGFAIGWIAGRDT